MNIDAGVIYTALATVWAFLTTGFVWIYKGRIEDLRATIKSERDENRALMERLFKDQATAAVSSAAASTAAVAAATAAGVSPVTIAVTPEPPTKPKERRP
jgi:hypothetical protein